MKSNRLCPLCAPAQFGEVSRGRYRPLGRREVLVAVKTLRWGASDREKGMFLSEAGVLGQFDHPNVLKLEGVITRTPPERIVTEFMENGPLDSFLRVRQQRWLAVANVGISNVIYLIFKQSHGLPPGERGSVQRSAAGRDAQRHRGRDAVPRREKLRPSGSSGSKRAGQLQPGLQSVRLWPVQTNERPGPQHTHIHRLAGMELRTPPVPVTEDSDSFEARSPTGSSPPSGQQDSREVDGAGSLSASEVQLS